MQSTLEARPVVSAELQEKVLLGGDLSRLSVQERLAYYNNICLSLELNPLTRPFEYLSLSGKTVLYARKDCTEQLRTKRHVSVKIVSREVVEGIYVVTAQACMPDTDMPEGIRWDESIGAVPIENVKGEARANAMMKGETKAKRRVTLSICGLGMLDETEVDSIPGAKVMPEIPATPGLTYEQKYPGPKIVPPQASTVPSDRAPGVDPGQDLADKVGLSQSVPECSAVGNEIEAAIMVSDEDKRALRVMVSQKLNELRAGGKKGEL